MPRNTLSAILGLLLLGFGMMIFVRSAPALADQISCASSLRGGDVCDITFPNVLAAQTTYPNLVFRAGDKVTISASGCVQTGGSGSTWKRYVDPQGDKSDHLYHGKISIAGVTNGLVRLSTVVGKTLPAASGGPLTLGYEDDGYGDNGYWSHDDGTGGQCKDQSGPNGGRAAIHLVIQHQGRRIPRIGGRYGMCSAVDATTEICRIDRPDVTHASETYSAITFRPGDTVEIGAGGCVQTGGSGSTWKRYVNPSGPKSDHLYHGLISIPGTTAGAVRLSSVVNKALPVFAAGTLTLGYEDDGYGDNGYWSHDDGTQNQCKNIGPAFIDLKIIHQGAHVSLDGLEVTQAIQDIGNSVPLVAGKDTWVRAYLTGVLTAATVTGKLTVTRNHVTVATIMPQAPLTLTSGPSALRTRRETWSGSLNFKLPAGAIDGGASTFELALTDTATNQPLVCSACATTAVFQATPPLRVRLFALSYSSGTPAATHAPTSTDFSLLASWLGRAYPVAQVQSAIVTVAANDKWPFSCSQANAQLSAIRGNDVSNGVDSRTHYLALVSNAGGYMRGCASGVPSSADPSTVASAPTGNPAGANSPINAGGDTDASFGDWYGGHELGHTFGRAHPGFCNGNSSDDHAFPYPKGQISDDAGDDTGLDVGSTSPALSLVVLPGAARFDIMTYCNQPQWLSAYTYSAIRSRLIAENGSGGAPAAGAAAESIMATAQPVTGSYIHVVATVDLTAQTAKIRYVTPVKAALPDVSANQHAQIVLRDMAGRTIQTVTVALREDTDVPAGEHRTALVDAFVPNMADIGRLQLLLGGQVKDEFRATDGGPAAPSALAIVPSPDKQREQGYRLQWRPAAGAANVTYTVETSSDGKAWFTVGIGLSDPAVAISEAHATSPFIRVIATNGIRASTPVVIRGLAVAPARR